MALRIEAGTAKGRGFGNVDGTPSLLSRIKTWIVKDAASGGPGWYIIDDNSTHPTTPYIVASNYNGQATNASRAKILKFSLSASADTIVIANVMFHNVTTHVSGTPLQAFTLSSSENNEYGYNFRGGSDFLMFITVIGSAIDFVYITPWIGHTLLVENDFTATLAQDWIVESGDGGNQFSGYHLLQNVGPHLDADGKLYALFDNNGGSSQFLLYKNPTRTSDYLIGSSSMSSSLSTVTVTQANSSTVQGSITRNVVGSDDGDIEIDFKLYLGAGEGALFTEGNSYYIWDYVNGSTRVGYFKVLDIIGDTLVVSGLNSQVQFSAGACISPYGHRWVFNGSQASGNGGDGVSGLVMPYYSNHNFPITNRFSGNSRHGTTWLGILLTTMNPNDAGKFAVMRHWLYEVFDSTGANGSGAITNVNANRAYGKLDNLYVSAVAGMAPMSFGRVINGQNYLTYEVDSSYAFLVLDSESLS